MKETSRSLLFSFPARECTQTLCDALDCFHTLHRLQRMIKKKKKDFYNKILYSKDLKFTYHSKIKIGLLQKNKNLMPNPKTLFTYPYVILCNYQFTLMHKSEPRVNPTS